MTNNGLLGLLSASVGSLHRLKVLDLSDNDIKVNNQLHSYDRFVLILRFSHYNPIHNHFQNFQGSIPSEIGLLSSLTYFRLAYNSFVGSVPTELGTLEHLQLLQLNSNRLSGNISFSISRSHVGNESWNESSFVADCGAPSNFETPVLCAYCTMCCTYSC